MQVITRETILNVLMKEWQEKVGRVLFKLRDSYPGNNCDLLGRQLIIALNLKTGTSGMYNGVLYNVVGKLTDSTTLMLYFMQPHAATELIPVDLTVVDALFIKRTQEDWKWQIALS